MKNKWKKFSHIIQDLVLVGVLHFNMDTPIQQCDFFFLLTSLVTKIKYKLGIQK